MDTKHHVPEFETMVFKTLKELVGFPMKTAYTYAHSVLNDQNLHFYKGAWVP